MDKRIGAQLYTVRDFCKTERELDRTLSKISEIGYKTIQVSGVGPIPPETIKKIADQYGLEIVCTHRGFEEFVDHLDALIDAHKVLDCKIVGFGGMPVEYRDQVEKFVEIFCPIAEKIKAAGLQFAYHNHAFEFVRMGNGFAMDYILKNTDPENFQLILDVYWLAVAGLDPAEFIGQVSDRIAALHFKDLGMKTDNSVVMTEVMEGNLNWDKIIAASEKSAAKYALVEQDFCDGDPFESLKISYHNLAKKGFY